MNPNYVEKIKKAGASIELVGLFLILYNLLFIFILKGPFLIPLAITAIIGLVFLGLGWQIRKNPSAGSKGKLIISLILSVVLLVGGYLTTKTTGGLSFYLLIGIMVSSLLGLESIKKINNQSNEVPLKGASKAKDLLKMVLIAIVVIGLFIGLSYFALK